jgi:2-succinyl-5-enolpyruvyl-6-hydroxy-3-cyclohexene-1-carboxylate synthase
MSAAPDLDFRNTNSLWGSVLVETLYRLGLRHAVISPGSRSTPLTMAFARHPGIAALPVLDERSAAFFALGLAKRTRRPVVLLCTSGTAGANYFPAVIEAQESGVPLLVITADRPPEMRDCRSGQTIDQQKLFGNHVNFYHEYAVPAATLPLLRYLRQTTAHAWARTQWPVAGPVHLNAPFRDPLPPVADASTRAVAKNLDVAKFFRSVSTDVEGMHPAVPAATGPVTDLPRRGLIILGPVQPADPAAYAGLIGRLSATLGWPVLADALSPLRNHATLIPNLVTTYDLVARSRKLARQLRPAAVLSLEGWPTSKALRTWLEATAPEVYQLSPGNQNGDPLHLATRQLRIPLETLTANVRPVGRTGPWLEQWVGVEKALSRELERAVPGLPGRFEGRVCQLLPGLLPRRTPVFIANSMPVRDAEFFWPANDRGHALFFNRGANGIDGTLSTALGVAHEGRPAVLLTGDLALLHDSNGFLTLPRFKGSLTIVLINNEGGGIFGHLPVAQFDPPFEKYFATPQAANFAKLCAAYGAGHVQVRDWRHFAALLARLPRRGVRVLEIRTDRKRDVVTRSRLFAAAVRVAERL